MDVDNNLKLSAAEISAAFSDPFWAAKFPPIMTTEQAVELLHIPLGTIYSWRSRGLLGKCSRKTGKYVLFWRDRLIKLIFNEGLVDEDE
jgi:hypothetical protein